MRPSNSPERRQQIMDALLQVMASKGYEGATIGEIARSIGLTPGLLHYHFHSKQEILLAAIEGLETRHLARLEQAVAEAPADPLARLTAFVDVHVGLNAYASPSDLAFWVMLSGEALRQKEVRQGYAHLLERMHARLCTLLREGVDQGVFHSTDIAATATALIAVIEGYFVMSAVTPELIPRGTAAAHVMRMVKGLVGDSIAH